MNVNGVGSNVAKDYAAVYSNQPVAASNKSEEAKKTAKTVGAGTYQRTDSAEVYAEQAYQSNVPPDKDAGTTFPMPSSICRLVEYTKAINEHYEKVNEENKKFDNPEKHIWDKYHNPKSPYYVKGLTDKERNICEEAETRVLFYVKEGWDKEDERGLTVGYKDGSLYDLDTDFGYGSGQREWLDKAKERRQQFWENYRKEREETLRTEKDIPVGYGKWLAELSRTEEIVSGLSDSTYSKTGTLLNQPDLKAMQQLLDYAVKNGRVIPLTKEILRLPGRVATQGGFDTQA